MIGEIPIEDPIRRHVAEDPVSRIAAIIKKRQDINMMRLEINMEVRAKL
jgi:hypothetical protein